MLPRDVNYWMGLGAVGSMVLVALVLVALVLQRAIGVAMVHRVERRQRALLPLVFQSIERPDSSRVLEQALRPFDLPIVRDMLMRFAMDLREQDTPKIVRVYDRLGLLQPEIRGLSALRSRTRRRAAANLGLLRQTTAVRPLLDLLHDRHVNVRLAAVDALADIGCEEGLLALIPLLEDQDPAIAGRAQEALCRTGRDVGAHVIRFLERTRDRHASRAALESLRWLDPAQAEERLCRIARSRHAHLRAQTAMSLAAIGSRPCGIALHALLSDASHEVRAEAARAMGVLRRFGSVPALRGVLLDRAWQVRLQATRALVDSGEPGITALMEELAKQAQAQPAGAAVHPA